MVKQDFLLPDASEVPRLWTESTELSASGVNSKLNVHYAQLHIFLSKKWDAFYARYSNVGARLLSNC